MPSRSSRSNSGSTDMRNAEVTEEEQAKMDELVRRCCFAGTEEEHHAREEAAEREKHAYLHAAAAEIRARTAAMALSQ